MDGRDTIDKTKEEFFFYSILPSSNPAWVNPKLLPKVLITRELYPFVVLTIPSIEDVNANLIQSALAKIDQDNPRIKLIVNKMDVLYFE